MSSLLLMAVLATATSPGDAQSPPAPIETPNARADDGGFEDPIPPPDALPEDTATPLETAGWQILAGGGLCFLLACPGAPLTLGASMLAGPAVVGWVTGNLGDRIGGQRAPWLWSLVGAYTGAILFGGVITGATLVGLIVGLVIMNAGAGLAAQQIIALGLTVGGLINLAATSVATGAGGAIGYALTAEPKRPGDLGEEPAGFSEPGHPDDGTAVEPPVDELSMRNGAQQQRVFVTNIVGMAY